MNLTKKLWNIVGRVTRSEYIVQVQEGVDSEGSSREAHKK